MTTIHPELHTSRQFQGLILPAHPTTGTEDDDDDRADEMGRPEDDDAEEEEPEEEMAAPESAAAVPEPATLSLLGLGLAAVGLKGQTRPV